MFKVFVHCVSKVVTLLHHLYMEIYIGTCGILLLRNLICYFHLFDAMRLNFVKIPLKLNLILLFKNVTTLRRCMDLLVSYDLQRFNLSVRFIPTYRIFSPVINKHSDINVNIVFGY